MLRSSDGGWVLPLSIVQGLEVSRGRRSPGERLARGAGFGLLVGGGLGAALGVMGGGDKYGRGEGALFFGGYLGAAGAVIGGLIGVASPGDRWQRVSLPNRVSVAPRWSRKKGFGLVASVAF
jgi:hypothetical protein